MLVEVEVGVGVGVGVAVAVEVAVASAMGAFKSEWTKENPRGVWWDTFGGRWGGEWRGPATG